DINSVAPNANSKFEINGQLSNAKVWDITNIYDVKEQDVNLSQGQTNQKIDFTLPTDTLKEFVVFDEGDTSVSYIGRVNNQNLHALTSKDYVIVAHPKFLNHAESLADMHRNDGLKVV